MACRTCTAADVEEQRTAAAEIGAEVRRKFATIREPRTSVELVDLDRVGDRWFEARMESWRAKHPYVYVGRDREPRRIGERERDAEGFYTRLKERIGFLAAFAWAGNVFVTPGAPKGILGHELVHANSSQASLEWLFTRVRDPITADEFNESLTEYFATQLSDGAGASTAPPFIAKQFGLDAKDVSLPAAYARGPDVIRELRDQRLGGPEVGEEVLRAFYFRDNWQMLERQLEQTGGVASFFDDYKRRVHPPIVLSPTSVEDAPDGPMHDERDLPDESPKPGTVP